MKVHLKTFQLLQKYQMWPVFSLPGTTAEAAELWEAGVGYTQFVKKAPANQKVAAIHGFLGGFWGG